MRKILIVEDEPTIADTIRYALETEGFAVVWCATAHEAFHTFAQQEIRLIILDIGLPDISGFEFCREIRRESSVPVIFLTARADEVDRVVGLEIGADDYVVKPFSPRELSARVKAVLRRTDSGDSSNRDESNTPFSVDDNKKRIVYFEEVLDLSRYEYKMLALFVSRPGWVFTRDKLMDMIWEEPESSMDRTVDTHIKTLRMKLHKIRPDLTPILTHRGVGYSLKESF
jgi:two-component system catabolic regulation response regulator CreB